MVSTIVLPRLAIPYDIVKTDQAARIICPYDDCYLTFVDESLCDFLRDMFDDAKASFPNNRNCISTDDGYLYNCLNILSKRRFSPERETEYADPYLLQLMTDYQVRLDICLAGWTKRISFRVDQQLIIYRRGMVTAALALSETHIEGVVYDKLTLQLRH
jgi:hypothetical protein